jgi:carbon starvation protein
MLALIVVLGAVAFLLAFRSYGRALDRVFAVERPSPTPAHTLRDEKDYCPARGSVLFGHHFSSIAGAGPIVGPIFATLLFGWLPAVLWIVVGSIFVGGVHDFGSLALSIKHRAQSIAQIASSQLTPRASRLFLLFTWLALVYVLIVFLDLTAATFAPRPPAEMHPSDALALTRRGGGVATSSLLFVVLALVLGRLLRRYPGALRRASFVFVPLVFASVYLGQLAPLTGADQSGWRIALLLYCFVASVVPVWLLLQPRDYLSAFLLYVCLGGGLLGIVIGSVSGAEQMHLRFPAFLGFHAERLGALGGLFPALFVTIACGACSGFHSIVASGTTAKQLDRTTDARLIGYGSMLVEGMLALVAVATVAVVAQGSAESKLAPPALFAHGLSRFLAQFGLPERVGQSFGMLSLSTFLLTTLDTCTRLARYTLTELLQLRGKRNAILATIATLLAPLLLTAVTFRDASGQPIPAWKMIWPVFGATNQLLGALALLVLTVWLKRSQRNYWVTLVPMLFMLGATLVALFQLTVTHGLSLIGGIAAALLALALLLLVEAALSSTRARPRALPQAEKVDG